MKTKTPDRISCKFGFDYTENNNEFNFSADLKGEFYKDDREYVIENIVILKIVFYDQKGLITNPSEEMLKRANEVIESDNKELEIAAYAEVQNYLIGYFEDERDGRDR